MDAQTVFARTEQGRLELFGGQPTLKPRTRQVLFMVSEAITLTALREKLPTCRELELILRELCDAGFIVQAVAQGATAGTGPTGIAGARQAALDIVRTLVGERSPAYARLHSASDRDALLEAVRAGKKVIAAVSSASRAEQFVATVEARLDGHESGPS